MGTTPNFQLHEISPSDLEDVARFVLRVSGSDTPLPRAVERLSWILLENPARASADSLGWLLRATSGEVSGEVVGCMCCAPQKFCVEQKVFTLMMANSFYVDERYHGAGTSIFLKYLQLGRRYPLFVSSANAAVAEMWRRLGANPLGNSGHEVFGVLRWPPLLAEKVYRKVGNDFFAGVTSAVGSPLFPAHRKLLTQAAGKLAPLGSHEEAVGICAKQRGSKITNCRDVEFLRWRYFSNADPSTRLFAFQPDSACEKFMIGIRLQNRGYKQQIRTLHVLDIWGEADPAMCVAIADCLWREYCEQIDMLVFRCLDSAQQAALMAKGFRLRSFASPIAWCLDKFGLLPKKDWYFVPADGDMFL